MVVQYDATRSDKSGENIFTWLREVSQNVHQPTYVLRRLAASSNPEFRIAVADHLDTPEELMLLLADDDNADVRYAIAENHNISRNVLNKLRDDSNPYVVHRAERTLARLDAEDQTLAIDNNFSPIPESAICERQQSNTELECQRLLTLHTESGEPGNVMVVELCDLHSFNVECHDEPPIKPPDSAAA